MDHTQLRQFVAAARHLHFAHAARDLGIPRPTLIAAIKAMEGQLGYELFDGASGTTQLTPAGEKLLVDAEVQLQKSATAAAASAAKPGGKAKASKGRGRAPAVKGERRPGKPRQGR